MRSFCSVYTFVICYCFSEVLSATRKIEDCLVIVKRLLVEGVDQWNYRLSEATKKKDTEKKKEKPVTIELESPSIADNKIYSEFNEIHNSPSNQINEDTAGNTTLSKKIRSLDSDSKYYNF